MKSLVLITVDCLRADHVGFLGYDRPTTPFLDSLAKESVVFSNAIVAGSPTYYSIPAIMASRHPLALGRDIIGLAPGEPTLATELREAGYETAAFLAANPYLSPRFGYDSGFTVFRDFLDTELAPVKPASSSGNGREGSAWNRRIAALCHRLGPLGELYDEAYFQYCQRVATPAPQSLDQLRRFPSADVLVDHAKAWLARLGESPFFLWLHFMDPHAPYYPPQPALNLMGTGQMSAGRARYLNDSWNRSDLSLSRLQRHREEIVALYDAGIRWADTQIARLVGALHDFELWDRCMVALTADHGEEFLDHGGRFHPPLKLAPELTRVPLLLRSPDGRASCVESPFSLLHLAPTLLHGIGLAAPPEFRGSNRWPEIQTSKITGEPAIAECISDCTNPFRSGDRLGPRILAVWDMRFKLVLDFRSSKEELFDLEADPNELRPLPVGTATRLHRRLLDHARCHLAQAMESRDCMQRVAARVHELQLEWANSPTRN